MKWSSGKRIDLEHVIKTTPHIVLDGLDFLGELKDANSGINFRWFANREAVEVDEGAVHALQGGTYAVEVPCIS